MIRCLRESGRHGDTKADKTATVWVQTGPRSADKPVMRFMLAFALVLAAVAGPEISVTPVSGEPGATFTVKGIDFDPGNRVKIVWDGANLGGTVKVGADGTFVYSGTVPQDASLGTHTIGAVTVGGGRSDARTTYTVITAITTTTQPITTTTTQGTTTTTQGTTATSSGQAPVTTTASSDKPATTPAPASEAQSPEPVGTDEADETGAALPVPSTVAPLAEQAEAGSGTVDGAVTESPQPDEGSSGIGLAGFVVMLLVVGAGAASLFFLWGRRRGEEDDGQTPRPSDRAEALPPPLPPLSTSDSGEWTRRTLEIPPDVELASVTQVDSGFVGLGWNTREEGPAYAAVWHSADGVEWHFSSSLGSVAGLLAIPWRSGTLVTASDRTDPQRSPSSWYSADGKDWERLAGGNDESLSGVSFEGGVSTHEVVVAWGRGPDGPGLWQSRDGSEWTRSELAQEVDLIVYAEGELIGFGKEQDSKRSFVARSADGTSWSKSGDGARSAFEGVSPASLVSFQGGMVMAGSDLMRGIGAVLVSDDGQGWYRVPFQPADGTSIEHLAVCEDRLLAVGADTRRRRGGTGTLVVWESVDAVDWKRVDSVDLLSDAVGHSVTSADGSVRIWGAVFAGQDVDSPPVAVHWEWSPVPRQKSDADTVPDEHTEPIFAAGISAG